MNKMFNKIKKKHGETFAKAIRDHHPAVLDIPNLDSIIKYSGSDTAIFPYLYSLTQKESYSTSNEYDYIELFNKAGYSVEHTTTVESFKKYKTYFKKDELLCSFNNIQNRLNNFICLWAVKHNVSEINRSKAPTREDEYGTSVICIQFSKKSNFISIKNRYNHNVVNPDNTFNSNPDNIINGLSSAIEKHFNVSFKKDNSVPEGFFVATDNKIIKVLNEFDGVYFGINCYIKNGVLVELNTDYELLFDTYILNIKTKTVYNLVDNDDCFVDIVNELLGSNNVYIENKTIHIGDDNIVLNEYNQIIGLSLNNVESIGINFLGYNRGLRELSMNNVVNIGDYFLYYNAELRELSLNNVVSIGYNFLYQNTELRELSLNNVVSIGINFLCYNEELRELSLNKVKNIGNNFLTHNKELRELRLDNVKNIGDYFLSYNKELRELRLDSVESIGISFITHNNTELRELSLNNIVSIGDYFLYNNTELRELCLDSVESIGHDFLFNNTELRELHLDNVETIGNNFLHFNNNTELRELSLNNVVSIGDNFLCHNKELRELCLDNVVSFGHGFLYYNDELREKINK